MSETLRMRLLCVDQRRCWEQGERVPVEAYLDREPELRADPERVLDLILNEVVLREELGDTPRIEEFQRRFPQWDSQIRLQFEVHQAIQADRLHGTTSLRKDWISGSNGGPPAAAAPEAVPGYEILRELGRGGMGVVYLARQVDLRRLVALKMVLASSHAGPQELARFQTEAEAVARLHHPNVVQIYQVGEQNGRPFLSLELVNGGSLARRLGRTPQAPRLAAHLVEVLARAMHHAHQQGIVHRDLKPSNILLAGGPGTPVGPWTPKITDFGLAKLLDGTARLTPTEALLGTPNYMAPEQAAGRTKEISPVSDVYALGAILYELLTGRPPFQAETPLVTLQQVISEEPLGPSRLQPRIPRDVETICLKCLNKEPGKRYPSAAELAEDLRRFLAGEPVLARRIPAWEHGVKWARRRPAPAALVGVCGLAAVSLIGASLWLSSVHRRRREVLRGEAQQLVFNAQMAWSAGDWQGAKFQLSSALDKVGSEPSLADLQGQAAHLLAEANRRWEAQVTRRRARAKMERFEQWRNQALFHGTQPVSTDWAANVAATRHAACEALALVGLAVDSAGTPVLDPAWNQEEKAEITGDCYELLLVLADAVARPGPSQGREARPNHAAQAIQLLDLAARLSPPTRAYHVRRAQFLDQRGDHAGGQKERDQAQVIQPATAIDFFLLGEEGFHQGDVAKAMEGFRHALQAQPDHFWAQYYLAVCSLERRHPREAEVGLTACLGRRPDFIWTYLLRGSARIQLKEYPAAEADFRKAGELHPDEDARFALFYYRGVMRLQQERFGEAVADLERAIVLKPNLGHAYLALAGADQQQNKLPQAAKVLAQALRLPMSPLHRANLLAEQGRTFRLADRYEEALKASDAALAIRLDRERAGADMSALAYRVRGEALLNLNRDEEAAGSFDQALRWGEPLRDIYQGRGLARMKLGQYAGALDDYTEAMKIKPDAEIYTQQGWAYFFCDAWKLALRDFETAIRLDPEDRDAYAGRGLARVSLGRYREAVADAEEAWRRNPDTPEMIHNIACTFALAAGKAEADQAQPDRQALAARYRERALEAIRQTLDRLPPSGRWTFWRDKILPDPYLDPIRRSSGFTHLEASLKAEHSPSGP